MKGPYIVACFLYNNLYLSNIQILDIFQNKSQFWKTINNKTNMTIAYKIWTIDFDVKSFIFNLKNNNNNNKVKSWYL